MYISSNQIKQRIGPQLVPYWNNQRRYAGFSDTRYYIWNISQVQQYLNSNPIQGANLGEGFDCDDFTYVLKGQLAISNRNQYGHLASIGIGIAWGHFSWINTQELHATNWFIDTQGIFRWIEPQNNTIYDLNNCIPGTLSLLLL